MVTIREVVTKKDINTFVKFPWKVYKGDPNWVPPLIFDMKNTLNRKKHPFFEFGEAVFFLAERDGVCVGRVSAHINGMHNKHLKVNEGFFGFYECLEDDEAAVALMKAAEDWLRAKGVDKMVGPESYTVYDEIAFLAEGRENEPSTPVMMLPYTQQYYLEQMKKAGLEKEVDWYAFKVSKDAEIKPIFFKLKDRLLRQGFTFRNINMKKLDDEVEKIKRIVNASWDENWGHVPLSDKQFEHIKDALKMLVDPRIVFLVEKDGDTVGCAISLPDVNPSVKKMNGRLFPFGWFHFLRAKKKSKVLRTFLFGVLPEYRNKGLDVVMVLDTIKDGTAAGYEWSDCSLVVETNKKMIEPILKWGGHSYKTYRLFSKKL